VNFYEEKKNKNHFRKAKTTSAVKIKRLQQESISSKWKW